MGARCPRRRRCMSSPELRNPPPSVGAFLLRRHPREDELTGVRPTPPTGAFLPAAPTPGGSGRSRPESPHRRRTRAGPGALPRGPGGASEERRRRVPRPAVEVTLELELPRGVVARHVADLAEDRPLGPPGAIVAAEAPEDPAVGVGVAAVERVLVVELDQDLERRPRRRRSTRASSCPTACAGSCGSAPRARAAAARRSRARRAFRRARTRRGRKSSAADRRRASRGSRAPSRAATRSDRSPRGGWRRS